MKRKLLLVDDSNLFLEIEKSLFKRTGAEILTARSGIEALKLAIVEKPDVVLLDLMLPDLNGDKVCFELKNNPLTAAIPVIMVTTWGRPEDLEKCRQAGCNDYVTKPIRHTELLSKVSQLLNIPHRLSVRILVRLETEINRNDQVLFGTSIDLSIAGILIELDRQLKENEFVRLKFFLPDHHEISTTAKIVRSESLPGKRYRYGMAFQDLTPGHSQRLRNFLENRMKA